MLIATIIVYLFYLYLLIGLIFALWFVFLGVKTIDPGTKEASIWLKLLLIPGSIALWWLLLRKYFRTKKSMTHGS